MSNQDRRNQDMPEKGAYNPPDEITWESPEPKVGRPPGSKWDPIAKMLKNNPGKWACLGHDMPTGIVTVIKKGTLKCFQPEGSFETATRNHTERWRADVYARYVGENGEYA
jgi:hypothetical protein